MSTPTATPRSLRAELDERRELHRLLRLEQVVEALERRASLYDRPPLGLQRALDDFRAERALLLSRRAAA